MVPVLPVPALIFLKRQRWLQGGWQCDTATAYLGQHQEGAVHGIIEVVHEEV